MSPLLSWSLSPSSFSIVVIVIAATNQDQHRKGGGKCSGAASGSTWTEHDWAVWNQWWATWGGAAWGGWGR